MKPEEKQLLLRDLCARLPYNVRVKQGSWEHILESVNMHTLSFDTSCAIPIPYLRPMSSMTKEEFQELHSICPHSTFSKTNVPGWIIGIDGSEYGRISRIDEISKLIDWLNAHHFDYRGLIEMGLALEAHKDMYKTEK